MTNTITNRWSAALRTIGLLIAATIVLCGAGRAQSDSKPIVVAHYMPWYATKSFSGAWGWHWTMNHYNPDNVVAGRPDAASRYRPLIGLYDSNDLDVLRCQVLQMKLAGIQGVMIDWYGNDDFNDFGVNNRNSLQMIRAIASARMKYAIVYEDSTVPKEIAGGLIAAADAVGHGRRLMQWMEQNMFSSPAYLKLGGRPVLLVFGNPYYSDDQYQQMFSVLPDKPLLFTQCFPGSRSFPESGAGDFDWPLPSGGTRYALDQQQQFLARMSSWPLAIACAFPRFDDIYAEAGVGKSWGHVDDNDGQTYVETLTSALKSNARIVQLVTWNDYGEGTGIEPTVEYGYRDLETTQRLTRELVDPDLRYSAADLRFPIAWYELKKRYDGSATMCAKLDAIYAEAAAGDVRRAEARLRQVAR
jgi:hypothetical protein